MHFDLSADDVGGFERRYSYYCKFERKSPRKAPQDRDRVVISLTVLRHSDRG